MRGASLASQGRLTVLFEYPAPEAALARAKAKAAGRINDLPVDYADGLIRIGTQSAINMAVNLHLIPAKGMTLPFISYGGSSMISLAYGMGMLLALTRADVQAADMLFATLDPTLRALSLPHGGKAMLSTFQKASGSPDPTTDAEFGDGAGDRRFDELGKAEDQDRIGAEGERVADEPCDDLGPAGAAPGTPRSGRPATRRRRRAGRTADGHHVAVRQLRRLVAGRAAR